MPSDLFIIGASGLRAHQAAMGVISDNIANATTPGYNRRSLNIKESPVSSSPMIYYRSSTSFGGSDIGGVVRANDSYLDQAARQAETLAGRAEQRFKWLADMQSALNDGPLGIGQTMTGMFNAVEKLAANPTDATLRMNVLFSFEQVNTAFRQTSTDLKTVRAGIGTEATNETTALNNALDQLAHANLGLRRAGDGTAGQAQLLDERDQALAEVAKRLPATVTFDEKGVAQLSYDGQDLVVQGVASTVAVTQNADGTLDFTVNAVSVADPASGTLGGLAQNGETVRDRIASIDQLAQQYVTQVNSWHAQGQTAAGNPGGAMLSIGADAGTIQTLITNPADIAGANSAGVINGNLIAINSLRGNGSVEQGWTALIANHASMVHGAEQEGTATNNRLQLALQAQADVSGVNLDREAAELMRLQQAYQASARIIQVARELSQTIFSIF
ncbi:flagellar hook-associated protein FlgK [Sphingobium sp. CR28]|uniref:flagellar hook-associated protein FlgK n=1 Tax=Sphingobium sp. CR28 TaxID=3400272 RepID=UPI003FEF96AC